MDTERFRQAVLNFKSALKEMALVHMDAGQDQAAGSLLVLERRVYTSMLHYDLQAPAEGDTAVEKAPPKRRSRKSAPEAQPELPVEP